MRSITLENFQTVLIQVIDNFIKIRVKQKAADTTDDLGASFTETINSLRSTVRAATDHISLHINVNDFINYHLGGLRGWWPLCNESQLKDKLKQVLNNEQYSLLSLTKAELSEKNTIIHEKDSVISQKLAEIEELKKALSAANNKEKEEASPSRSAENTSSTPRLSKPTISGTLREKEFEKMASKSSELEIKIQQLQAAITKQEAEKNEAVEARDDFEYKYQTAMLEIENKNKQIAELEKAAVKETPIKRKPERHRLTGGAFGMRSN